MAKYRSMSISLIPYPVDGEMLVDIKASVLENFDKGTVSGKHYSSNSLYPQFPAVVGTDGIGMTADGKMVGFGKIRPPYGAFAEKAVAAYTVPIPEGIDAVRASAMPRSTLTSLLPLKYSAKLQPGETVLVNGATGVSGRIAIQVAKMMGAGKVIATGRNERSLGLLPGLGADVVIDLKQGDGDLAKAFMEAGGSNGIDVVVDFIWGHPAEVLIGTFIPNGSGVCQAADKIYSNRRKSGITYFLTGFGVAHFWSRVDGGGKVVIRGGAGGDEAGLGLDRGR